MRLGCKKFLVALADDEEQPAIARATAPMLPGWVVPTRTIRIDISGQGFRKFAILAPRPAWAEFFDIHGIELCTLCSTWL